MDDQQSMPAKELNPVAAGPAWPDVTQIINIVIDVCLERKDKEQAVIELVKQYKDAAVYRIEILARGKLKELLENSEKEKVKELSEKQFADRLIDSSKGIADAVRAFYRNELTLQELIDSLAKTGIYEVARDAMGALGVQNLLHNRGLDAIWNMSADTVGYASLTAVYQELMKALEDEQIAHERRVRIEQECAAAVASITKYRSDMERVVNEYLKVRYEAFEKGFAAMDQAILDNDADGYIRGNAEIQKALGYSVKFSSQDEFDDLMMSDETFTF